MDVQVEPGKYVVAVSGGVDSVVLLDVLRQKPDLDLVVAHFDHGIRDDSAEDQKLVAQLAASYDLPFVSAQGKLGKDASEAVARDARYDFLRQVLCEHKARAIITAHHQDDLVETALLQLARGSGRKGLSSLQSQKEIVRPLLDIPKSTLMSYALQHHLSWREDTTNYDERYTRNYLRLHVLGNLSASARQQLLANLKRGALTNAQLDQELEHFLANQPEQGMERRSFLKLPDDISREVLASWLRAQGVREFDRHTLNRLVTQIKTLPPGKQLDVIKGASIYIGQDHLALRGLER